MKTQTSKKATSPKKRIHRSFSAEQKTRAVLALWTESRKPAEICRELEIQPAQLDLWQKKAMDAVLKAMEPRTTQPGEARPLPQRLEKILKRRVRQAPVSRLVKKLEQAQTTQPTPTP